MNNKLTSPNLFSDVCGIIDQGRQQAYAAVNKSMIETYWNIGKRIVEEEQSGKERAEYGEEIINYCCPIKPLHAALLSLNAAEILMISSNFQFQAPLE